MSLTFGERMTAMEEKLEILAQMLASLLYGVGLTDEDGNWIEVDK